MHPQRQQGFFSITVRIAFDGASQDRCRTVRPADRGRRDRAVGGSSGVDRAPVLGTGFGGGLDVGSAGCVARRWPARRASWADASANGLCTSAKDATFQRERPSSSLTGRASGIIRPPLSHSAGVTA
jgi:hypothetical protein